MQIVSEERSLKDFILGAKNQLEGRVKDLFAPRFLPGEPLEQTIQLRAGKYPKTPFKAQISAIAALVKGFMSNIRTLGLIAEMGCGKVRRVGA